MSETRLEVHIVETSQEAPVKPALDEAKGRSESPFDPNAATPPDAGLFGLDCSLEAARVVVVPVPFDATTSYHRGTADAPALLLSASHQVDLLDLEAGTPYRAGIHMLEVEPAIRELNAAARAEVDHLNAHADDLSPASEPERKASLAIVNQASADLETWLSNTVSPLLDAGKLVCVLGGDHSVPLGAIAATAARHPGLGILHIDAHADLRAAYQGYLQSHASIMYNVIQRIPAVAKLVQVGIRDLCEEELAMIDGMKGRIRSYFDPELRGSLFHGKTWAELCAQIVAELPEKVYVSFDIDGLDPALCPGTGTPVPGGLSFAEATFLIHAVVRSGRTIVGLDLTEVGSHEWDCNVGARMLYKLIGFALKSQTKKPAA